jgi:mannose-6-phosphate isomerase-like protein (cupin superfamily)
VTIPRSLRTHPLGRWFAHVDSQTAITPVEVGEDFWEQGVSALPPGRLLSSVRSEEDWTSWEMHPLGDELVLQLDGCMELILETPDGQTARRRLDAGHFIVVPPGVWHTADVLAPGTAIYLTHGEGTEHRPRK